VSVEFNRQEVQGNIPRGYRRDFVGHLILEVTDRAAARKFLGVSVAAEAPTFQESPARRHGAARSRPLVSTSA
jgi:hypothetical protein